MNIIKSGVNTPLKLLILSSFMAALTAVGAQIRIPMFPVPFTLQTLFVLLSGNLLGAIWGGYSMLLYLALGLIGFPVFAGTSGLGVVFTPTFGYLLSFPICAYWVGKRIAREKENKKSFRRIFIINVIGQIWIFGLGVPYLWLISKLYMGNHLPLKKALMVGFVMFIPGALIKAMVAAWITNHMKKRNLI